jgi:hypothetical protein
VSFKVMSESLNSLRIKYTDESSVSVLPPTRNYRCAVGVSNKKIWSCQGLENSTRCLSDKNCPIQMSFSHMIHVDGVDDGAGGGRSDLPYRTAECMSCVEWSDCQALTFP